MNHGFKMSCNYFGCKIYARLYILLLTMVRSLLSWKDDTQTSSFHLPISEISITLDDVSPLLHLSITQRLLNYSKITRPNALDMMVRYLRADPDDAQHEIDEMTPEDIMSDLDFWRSYIDTTWMQNLRMMVIMHRLCIIEYVH